MQIRKECCILFPTAPHDFLKCIGTARILKICTGILTLSKMAYTLVDTRKFQIDKKRIIDYILL